MKKVIKYLEENNKSSEIDGFKTNIQKVIQILKVTKTFPLIECSLGLLNT
jgi:hypothetical protein